MKTLADIDREMQKLRKRIEIGEYGKEIYDKLDLLQQCKLYLETEPDEIYLGKHQKRLTDLLTKLDDEYRYHYPNANDGKHYEKYAKTHQIEQKKYQLRTLNYLLG